MMNKEYLTTILELLQGSEEHGISEIKDTIPLNNDAIYKILDFLHEEGFINKSNDELRICSKGLKFLRLP